MARRVVPAAIAVPAVIVMVVMVVTIVTIAVAGATRANVLVRPEVRLGGRLVITSAIADLVPGDTITRAAWIENRGTEPVRYTVRASLTGSPRLGRAVSIVVKIDVDDCRGEAFARRGVVVAVGTIAHVSFRDPRSRVLAAARREQLCVQEQLSAGAGNEFEGLRATSVLTFAYAGLTQSEACCFSKAASAARTSQASNRIGRGMPSDRRVSR